MAKITFKDKPVTTNGELPKVGSQAPDFNLTSTELANKQLKDFSGKRKVLNIFPSVDTAVCATSVRKFNERAAKLTNTVVLGVSADLPFAHKRFCAAEGLENVVSLSMMHDRHFGLDYGVLMQDGPLASLTARAVVVLDESNKVLHTELVPELTHEPDYDAALKALG